MGGGGEKGAAPWPTSSRAHLSSERPGPRPSGPREPVSGAQKSFPPAGPRSWRRSLFGRMMMMMMPICRGQARRDGRQRVFRLAMKEPALYHPRLGPSRLVQTKLAPLAWPGPWCLNSVSWFDSPPKRHSKSTSSMVSRPATPLHPFSPRPRGPRHALALVVSSLGKRA